MWRISIKTKKLSEEDKIKFLANELIKSVQASGKIISYPNIGQGFGSVEIVVHGFGTESASLKIENSINKWEISTKPTFKKLEVAE